MTSHSLNTIQNTNAAKKKTTTKPYEKQLISYERIEKKKLTSTITCVCRFQLNMSINIRVFLVIDVPQHI